MKTPFLTLLLWITLGTTYAQTITFSNDTILTNKSSLSMTVRLQKPLADYLHDLAPTLSKDSLCKVGNYQFFFYVDGQLIYHTELWPGAPRPAQQQTDTVWTKPLIDNQNEYGLWSLSAWARFMMNGGDSALTDGRHIVSIVLRPYVKIPELLSGDIIAEGYVKLNVQRTPKVTNETVTPVKPYKELKVSTEPFDRDKIRTLRAYIEQGAYRHITSIVVLKKGKILLEEYYNGSNRDSLHDVRSVGKTFASAMTGIAIRDKILPSENQVLGTIYFVSPEKGLIQLRELLTMSSPFDGDDDDEHSPGNEENMYPTDNWVQFTLNLPLDTVKYHGQWHYFTAGVMLLGSALDKIVPGGLEKYADAQLFQPLGITNYKWQYTPQHVANTAGGIRMNALDFAKFGQLYANKGHWGNKQILPADWVDKSLSHQLPIPGRNDEFYGYLFWNKKYGKHEVYYCSGNGGNKIFIFKDMVVVVTATAYNRPYAHRQVDDIMTKFLLPAVTQ